jgi:hypothetical protein
MGHRNDNTLREGKVRRGRTWPMQGAQFHGYGSLSSDENEIVGGVEDRKLRL